MKSNLQIAKEVIKKLIDFNPERDSKFTWTVLCKEATTALSEIQEDKGLSELHAIADDFQEECHATVEMIIREKKGNVNYQDATNVWIFRKLAELQYQLNQGEGSQRSVASKATSELPSPEKQNP